MNRRQNQRQLVYLLRSARWSSDPAAELVLGDAFVSARDAEELAAIRTTPFAVVRSLGSEADPDHPGRSRVARYAVELVVPGQGHPAAQDAILGGARASLLGSGGAGADEIASRLETLYGDVASSTYGFQAQVVRRGAARPPEPGSPLVVLPLELEITDETTAARFHPARGLSATGGVGQVALSWALPPDRFDRLRVILRRASGSTPPASPSGGSPVALSGDLATSVTVTGLSAGSHAFALFAAYDSAADPPATVAATETDYSASASVVAVVT